MQDDARTNDLLEGEPDQDATVAPAISDERVEQAVRNLSDLAPEVDSVAIGADADGSPLEDARETTEQEAGQTVDEASGEDEKRPFVKASDAARGAQESLKAGIAAFKSVREATQLHSSARDELRSMQEILDGHTAELRHRIEIEQRYPQIVAEQTEELKAAQVAAQDATQRAEVAEADRAELESNLNIMKNRHEDELRPYRNVAESTKGRADDTARTLADAKRATKSAETSLSEATKRRDQRISAANRAVDNARERMRRVQAELESTQADENASSTAITRLQNELASEKAHFEAAVADVPVITEETRADVEGAQTRLFDQRQALAQIERDAEAAKKEANDRRAEYDTLLKKAQDEERALQEQIRLRTAAWEQARKEASDAQARIEVAQELLDEAEEIHATPQDTIALREQVGREQTDLDQQQDAVDELAANERDLRRGTFKQRLILVVGIIAVIAVVIGIVVAIFLGTRG